MATITCVTCGTECERRSVRQKYCLECSEIAKKKYQSDRNARIPKVRGMIGDTFNCERCGSETTRTHGAQKRCDACKPLAKAEKKKAGRPTPKGVRSPNKGWTIICCDCGVSCDRGANALRCFECAEAHGKKIQAKWRAANDNKLKEDKRRHYEENADVIRERAKEWRIANPEKRKEHLARCRENPRYRLRYAISNGIRISLKNGKGGKSWEVLVGYTVDELMRHLERQFVKGMTWDNYGEWHVDHILPDTSFSYAGPEDPEFRAAWALTNLRPLWANDNMSKGAKRLFLI